MWELDYKEGWVPTNWCFRTVVLEKTLESPLDCKEIQPVHPKGDQSWVFIGRTEFEAETPILWPPDAKSWLIRKDPYAGKDWKQEEKGMTEDEMVGSPTQWEWTWVNSGMVMDREACRAAVHGVTNSWTWLSDWTELNPIQYSDLENSMDSTVQGGSQRVKLNYFQQLNDFHFTFTLYLAPIKQEAFYILISNPYNNFEKSLYQWGHVWMG